MVGGRSHAAGRARHRVQPVRAYLLRPGPECDGRLGLELRCRVPGPDRPLARDLHDHELVAAVHRQLRGARCHEPALDRLLGQTVGQLPAGWSTYTFWQWSNQPVDFPGDQDVFNGSSAELAALANGPTPPAPPPPTPLPPPLPPPPPPPPQVLCRVPRVIGLRLQTARATIRRAHCSPGRVRRVRAKRAGRVLAQKPSAGRVRARGARVRLVVGRRPAGR